MGSETKRFQEAQQADIIVNGTALPGEVSGREFFGRPMSTAFLAFSETWVTPANLAPKKEGVI